jgi:hypothetical protein
MESFSFDPCGLRGRQGDRDRRTKFQPTVKGNSYFEITNEAEKILKTMVEKEAKITNVLLKNVLR